MAMTNFTSTTNAIFLPSLSTTVWSNMYIPSDSVLSNVSFNMETGTHEVEMIEKKLELDSKKLNSFLKKIGYV